MKKIIEEEKPIGPKRLHHTLIFKIFRVLILVALFLGIVAWCFNIYLGNKYTVPIIMYHAVNEVKNPKTATVHPETFRYQMNYLKSNGYNVMPFSELVAKIANQDNIPRKTVVLTFDDGYEDNYTVAFEILKEYNFPAIMFVSSDFIGTDNYLKWHQLLDMLKNRIEVGSHTRHHAYLPEFDYVQQYDEILESKKFLEQNLNTRVKYFSYPMGGFDDKVKDILKETGYLAAVTTNRGYDRFNKDPYELNRIRFGDKDNSDFILWAKLSGYYNLFRRLRKPY